MLEPAERLRIAHVVFSLGIGGLETGLINLLRSLVPAEFEHRIFCMKDLGPNTEKVTLTTARSITFGKSTGPAFCTGTRGATRHLTRSPAPSGEQSPNSAARMRWSGPRGSSRTTRKRCGASHRNGCSR